MNDTIILYFYLFFSFAFSTILANKKVNKVSQNFGSLSLNRARSKLLASDVTVLTSGDDVVFVSVPRCRPPARRAHGKCTAPLSIETIHSPSV